jgi:hypothetical protein
MMSRPLRAFIRLLVEFVQLARQELPSSPPKAKEEKKAVAKEEKKAVAKWLPVVVVVVVVPSKVAQAMERGARIMPLHCSGYVAARKGKPTLHVKQKTSEKKTAIDRAMFREGALNHCSCAARLLASKRSSL